MWQLEFMHFSPVILCFKQTKQISACVCVCTILCLHLTAGDTKENKRNMGFSNVKREDDSK